jgi:hypothetical protein
MGVATIDPLVTGPDGLDVALTAPASVSGGSTVTVGGTLSAGGQPVRGTVTWYSKPATGGSWVRVGGPAATTAAGTTSISTMPSASTTYELVVAQPVGSTWTASPAVVTVTVVKKPVTIASSITVGRPDKVRATMASGSTRVAGASVGLYYHYSGSTKWVLVQHYTTGSTGGIVVSVQPKRYTYYLWSYAGSAVYSAAQSKAVYTTY